jgi:hypothetical protein
VSVVLLRTKHCVSCLSTTAADYNHFMSSPFFNYPPARDVSCLPQPDYSLFMSSPLPTPPQLPSPQPQLPPRPPKKPFAQHGGTSCSSHPRSHPDQPSCVGTVVGCAAVGRALPCATHEQPRAFRDLRDASRVWAPGVGAVVTSPPHAGAHDTQAG